MTDVDRNYTDLVRSRLIEWGRIDKRLAVLQLSFIMPPGYSWRCYINARHPERIEIVDGFKEYPEPSHEDIVDAQRFLARSLVNQLKRRKRRPVIEYDDGTIEVAN